LWRKRYADRFPDLSGNELADNTCEIVLPKYSNKLATNWTVNLTSKMSSWNPDLKPLHSSDVENGKFKVFGENDRKFFWTVYGTRKNIDVEIEKSEYTLCGDGPYTYVNKKLN
jgi:hypothetical protein